MTQPSQTPGRGRRLPLTPRTGLDATVPDSPEEQPQRLPPTPAPTVPKV